MPAFTAHQLYRVGKGILMELGATEEEAEIVTRFLVKANLAGHDSHGVIRIAQYAKGIWKGEIVPGSATEVVVETPSSALLNGNWGFGQVTGFRASKIAIEKARSSTVSVICAYNCNHIDRLADYTMMIAENGMIGIAMANSVKIVSPYGGIDRMLSTGPLSYAFPTEKEVPFVLDIATSVCAEGKIRVSLHKGEKLPHKWIIDKNGQLTDNPSDLYEGGAILPFGGEVGYKGFGIGLAIDALSGILGRSGVAYHDNKRGNGVFMEAINIESFMPLDQFKREMDELIRTVKKSRPMPRFKEIMVPGEPESRSERQRIKKGVYIAEKTWEELTDVAKTLSVDIEKCLN